MWLSLTTTDTLHVHPTSTHPSSPPPPCVARVVVDKPSFPPPPPRKPANTSLQLTSTPREIRVPTMPNIILDMDVTEPTTIRTLQRVRCVVVVVAPNHFVQTQITISSTQLETRVFPQTSLTATDISTHRIFLLKSFVVNVVEASNGTPTPSKFPPQHLHVLTQCQTTTMHHVLNTTKTHRLAERTCVSISISTPLLLGHHHLNIYSPSTLE